MQVNLSAYVHVEGFPCGLLFKSLNDWSFGKQNQLFPSWEIIRYLYDNFIQKNSNQTGDIKERVIRKPPVTRKGDSNEGHEEMPLTRVWERRSLVYKKGM